ncbi:MAG: response regulator [Calditrichaeota bacterium]|nr:MAG: response regulator [Calditrichota bacterium]
MSLKFLAVDDSPTMRRIVANTLKRLGYEDVVEAINGKEALEKLATTTVDFIITDWNMPEMDGLEFVQNIKANGDTSEVPILMITTRGVKDDIVDAMKAGVNSYIIKPFTPQVLKEKIDSILSE